MHKHKKDDKCTKHILVDTYWQIWVHTGMDADSVAYSELSADKSLAKPILHIWCDNHKMMQLWDSRLDSRQTIAGTETCTSRHSHKHKAIHPNNCTSSDKSIARSSTFTDF